MIEQLLRSLVEPLGVRHEQVAVPCGPQLLADPHRGASIRLDQQPYSGIPRIQPIVFACPPSVAQQLLFLDEQLPASYPSSHSPRPASSGTDNLSGTARVAVRLER